MTLAQFTESLRTSARRLDYSHPMRADLDAICDSADFMAGTGSTVEQVQRFVDAQIIRVRAKHRASQGA